MDGWMDASSQKQTNKQTHMRARILSRQTDTQIQKSRQSVNLTLQVYECLQASV